MMSELLKKPPYSIEAEQHVLGAILQWPEAIDDIASMIKSEDFYRRDHCVIFDAILAMDAQHIDAFTVSEYLDRNKQEYGGFQYLGSLAANIPTSANVKAYAQVVANRATERRLIQAANQIMSACYSGKGDTESKIALASQVLSDALDSGLQDQDPRPIKDILTTVVDEIDRAFQNSDELQGLSTGLIDLDKKTGGLHPGLIIVAGRPSMGKSTLAFNIARHAAMQNISTLGFTLEMTGESVAKRELAAVSHVSHGKLRSGKLDDLDWPKLTSGMGQLAQAQLFIDDTSSLSIVTLRAKARRMKRKHNIGLIVIDYLQLMEMDAKNDNLNQAIGKITRALKLLAMELQVPIVLLSQLNRDLEKRVNKRPRMSDLRESGAIEQDADLILFIYRDEVYNEDSPYEGMAEIIIGKQREGALGMVPATFLPDICRFGNFEGSWPQPYATPAKRRGFEQGNQHADERAA